MSHTPRSAPTRNLTHMGSQQSQPSQVSRTSTRRRQRSTRITVAAALVVVSGVLVTAALVVGSTLFSTVAAFGAFALGAAATKIMHAEVLLSRTEAARDRAKQAQDYSEMTRARSEENATFAKEMQRRIIEREDAIVALEDALSGAQRQVAEQTLKFNAEARRAELAERTGAETTRQLGHADERAAEAIVLVAELEAELDVLKAELKNWKSGRRSRTA